MLALVCDKGGAAGVALVVLAIALTHVALDWQAAATVHISQAPVACGVPSLPEPAPVLAAGDNHRTCVFGNAVYGDVAYDCSSNFDAAFYRRTYSDVARVPDADLARHYDDVGVLSGRRAHPGQRTMKLILMTRDDWPLIRSWVLYHADLFGGDNLYVLDGSSDARQLDFMRDAARLLGVHHFRTHANLNWIIVEIQQLALNLTSTCDFITKVDTDEFIVTLAHDATFSPPSMHFEVGRVRSVLDMLPVDGARYSFSHYASVFPDDNCTVDSDSALSTRYERPWFIHLKVMFASRALAVIDLGNHIGLVRQPLFNQSIVHQTDLAIAHHHFRCFELYFLNTEKAMLSHGFIDKVDSIAVKIQKLAKLDTNIVASGHKVVEYMKMLKEPDSVRATYRKFVDGPDARVFTGLRDILLKRMADWDAATL